MTDRELLELAAKAAGIEVIRSRLEDPLNMDMLVNDSFRNIAQVAGAWNPLTDDGDALRLAVKLGLQYGIIKIDDCKATRRAIVRAAAEIGRAM